jgi:sulfur-oxidizing protein SoxB
VERAGLQAVGDLRRGGVRIGIIGQALPYTPIANPRWMIPNWSFGIREDHLRKQVELVRMTAHSWCAVVAQRL